jgi:hypothetical protein
MMALTPGGIYQHRDGHLACAVGVAYPMPAPQFAALPLFAVLVMSGSDRGVEVRRSGEGFVFPHLYFPGFVAPPLAIYACCGDIWLRDLAEFLSEFERVSVGVAA